MSLSLRARVSDRIARLVDFRIDRKLRPATQEWQRRLDKRVRPLANRMAAIDRHRDRLNEQGRVLSRHRDRLNRLEKSVERLRRDLRWTNDQVERIIPQVAAQEDRIETLRGKLALAPSTEDGDMAEARKLIDEVQRQHAQIRVRLSGMAFYEDRLRQLETTLAPSGTTTGGE